MRGTFRGQRLVDRAGRLAVDGMFSGVLLDDDGSRIGTASRRQHVPTHQTGPPGGPQFDIGPVDVDLLGLTVMIAKTTISGDEKD